MSAPSSTLFQPPSLFRGCELLAATGGSPVGALGEGPFRIVTDSRTAGPGTAFVALPGERFDGHDFLDAVVRAGAVALVRRDRASGVAVGVAVDDPLIALGDLARHHLLRLGTSVAAVTGSVGKTTTRSMLASILKEGLGPGLESEGNFNNRVGVPLTLLQLRAEHRFAVLEMGMSEPGEIRALARIARPRVRVITRIAPAHLAYFEDTSGIARAKGELFEDARPGDVLILNADQEESRLFPTPTGATVIRTSVRPGGGEAFVEATEDRGLAGGSATLVFGAERLRVELPLAGGFQWMNALQAAAAARALGARPEDVVRGLARVEVPGRRLKRRDLAGVTLVDDSYNANPASVEGALRTLAAAPTAGRRIAVLGDMLELGPGAEALHREVGTLAATLGLDLLVTAGPLMAGAAEAAARCGLRCHSEADAPTAGQFLTTVVREGDLVLFKGSRGMAMERALDTLAQRLGG